MFIHSIWIDTVLVTIAQLGVFYACYDHISEAKLSYGMNMIYAIPAFVLWLQHIKAMQNNVYKEISDKEQHQSEFQTIFN